MKTTKLLQHCKTLCLTLILPLLLSCSGEDKFEKLEFTMTPPKPVVVNANTTHLVDILGDGYDPQQGDRIVSIPGPWILITPRITNNTDKTMTIVTVEIVVSAVLDGRFQENRSILDTAEIGANILGTLKPGESGGPITGSNPATYNFHRWYIGGLPQTANPDEQTFVYSVRAIIHGWVGDFDEDAEARILKEIFFTTQ